MQASKSIDLSSFLPKKNVHNMTRAELIHLCLKLFEEIDIISEKLAIKCESEDSPHIFAVSLCD